MYISFLFIIDKASGASLDHKSLGEIWKPSILLQAGLIVKLLMKLSGQMTPNDKGVTDKYTYGWTLDERKPQLPKLPF